ncbi:MAG: DnaJ C-terminal domain-containing protein [Pseudomonadota bacterium]
MEFKDYYATLGVQRTATQDEIKRAYRKLARKFHPDVSKELDAESRFKDVAEAHEALIDPERRAAYDEISQRHARGEAFEPPPGWDSGFEFSGRGRPGPGAQQQPSAADFSAFFESIFGRGAQNARPAAGGHRQAPGSDHHAKVMIDLEDSYSGARRTISLRVPVVDAQGHVALHDRQLEVNIPPGVREGQHLRLAGQGGPGQGDEPPGDLYLEITLKPHPRFRVDGRDVFVDLPVSPWEAALGATVAAATPAGEVHLTIPAGSIQGRKLRLKGRGLPGKQPGDLYAVLTLTLPRADSDAAKAAYTALAAAFQGYDPRVAQEG